MFVLDFKSRNCFAYIVQFGQKKSPLKGLLKSFNINLISASEKTQERKK
jgi:hypothetical protein